tara:strand:- start:446 stop:1588 length:1143 start_codon:yes stop_codon:yes gene_type:complete
MKKKLLTAIGLMSGTSMDGIDLSIISSDGFDEFFNILDVYYPYTDKLQEQLITLRDMLSEEEDLLKNSIKLREIERSITLFHADIIEQTLQKYKGSIDLIGFHGQTIFHSPQKKITKQLGDGNLLSQIIKKKVIYDFRQADINNNGQGAPLTPIFHYILSKKINKNFNIEFPIGFLNIGGVSNVTKINKISDKINDNLLAFDIGPGNCLIDEWIRNNSSNKYDNNGEIAKSGKIDQLILNQVIDNFKFNNYSQSLDVNDFDTSFARGLSLENGCATITHFTAFLIAEGLRYASQNKNIKFLICGGGRKNNFLIQCIKQYLSNEKTISLDLVENYDLKGDYIESQAFGYLAVRSFLKLPISFNSTTGCNISSLGGKLAENF